MDAKQGAPVKRSVEDVFRDFQGRRKGLIKALTTDFDDFYQKCDPEKDNLCLYGIPNGSWEVNVPVEDVPPELPEPIVGINFAKEGLSASEWLSLVAMHSDAWLISVAFYFGARFMFDKNQRKMLFEKINELPNVFEVVTTQHPEQLPTSQSNVFEVFTAEQPEQLASSQSKGKETIPSEKMVEVSRNRNKIKPSGKMPQSRTFAPQPKRVMSPPTEKDSDSDEEEEEGEEEANEQGTNCGACGDDDDVDGFWICCDVCERWFHGQCVKITPAKAEHIKHYKCPSCSSRKARLH